MEQINMTLDYDVEKYHMPEVFLINLSLLGDINNFSISDERYNKLGEIHQDLKENQMSLTFTYDQTKYPTQGNFLSKLISFSVMHGFEVPNHATTEDSDLFII